MTPDHPIQPDVWKFYVQPAWWDNVTHVYLRGFSIDGGKSLAAKPLEFVEVEEGSKSEPFVVIHDRPAQDTSMLQAMMDGLWDSGLRPTNHRDHTQELGAVRTHLEDMRQLVFKDKLRGLQ